MKPKEIKKTKSVKKEFNKGKLDCETPKKKRISVQAAKSKGRNLQKLVGQFVADLLNERFGPDEDIASRPMGQSGVDIRMSRRILKKFPYSIECKHQEKWNVPGFIRQAQDNTLPNTDWLLFMTKNRDSVLDRTKCKEFVVMEFSHFCELMERIYNVKATPSKKL